MVDSPTPSSGHVASESGSARCASSARVHVCRLLHSLSATATLTEIVACAAWPDGTCEAHFFDVYDYLQARGALQAEIGLELGQDFQERLAVDASLVGAVGDDRRAEREEGQGGLGRRGHVVSVWVHCKRVERNRFPPATEDVFWTAAFDVPVHLPVDLRGSWHALAVSISPSDGGVTAYLDGELLPTRRLPEGVHLHVPTNDARVALANFASCGCLSGRVKNLAVYTRALRVMEAQTMTTRVPAPTVGWSEEVGVDSNKSKRAKAKAGDQDDNAGEESKPPEVWYEELVLGTPAVSGAARRGPCPQGYWPMQESAETGGGTCLDVSHKGSDVLDAGQDLRSPGKLVCEARIAGAITRGDVGPPSIGGVSVCLFGGCLRSAAGAMCKVPNVSGATAETHALPDLTLELWVRRTVPAARGNPRETLVSADAEAQPLHHALSWFLTSDGLLDVAIAGCERTVGPCPEAAIRDLEWHHIAVSRTSDPRRVNNWSFYVDGKVVWTTRHDGVPTAHASATLLLGKQHGSGWGLERAWRSGVGDPTCFQVFRQLDRPAPPARPRVRHPVFMRVHDQGD